METFVNFSGRTLVLILLASVPPCCSLLAFLVALSYAVACVACSSGPCSADGLRGPARSRPPPPLVPRVRVPCSISDSSFLLRACQQEQQDLSLSALSTPAKSPNSACPLFTPLLSADSPPLQCLPQPSTTRPLPKKQLRTTPPPSPARSCSSLEVRPFVSWPGPSRSLNLCCVQSRRADWGEKLLV